jgi:hypothetical protein
LLNSFVIVAEIIGELDNDIKRIEAFSKAHAA